MTQSASQNFITSFDAMVKQAYSRGGILRPAVRVKTGVVGSSHVFPKLGRGVATLRVPQTDVVPMNVIHTKATATLQDWNAPEYSDIFDLQKLSFNERQELASTVADALGRRSDQLVINAMVASSGATVDVNVGGATTGLNLAKILRAKRHLDDAGVPNDGRRTFVTSARAVEQALAETTINSVDYNALRPLMEGSLTAYAGFKFVFIESRTEGGMPLVTTTRSNFAFHQDAVGLAVGLDMRTSVDWIAEKTSWLINGMMSAGAVTVDAPGVVLVQTTET